MDQNIVDLTFDTFEPFQDTLNSSLKVFSESVLAQKRSQTEVEYNDILPME